MLKKCISILLVIFLSINSGGFIVLFYQAQHAARNQMMDSLQTGNYKADEVVRFKLDNDRLYRNGGGYLWKDAREFEYGGQMYDIIKIVKEDSRVILYCINDISEAKIFTAFNNELNGLASGKVNNSKNRTSLLNLISQALFFNPFRLKSPEGRQNFTSNFSLHLIYIIEDIPSPPPRTA